MLHILEAHPAHAEHSVLGPAFYAYSSAPELVTVENALYALAMGAIATGEQRGACMNFAEIVTTSTPDGAQQSIAIPADAGRSVGVVLGEKVEQHLDRWRDQLLLAGADGRMHRDDVRQQVREVTYMMTAENGVGAVRWLTKDGIISKYRDGGIVPDVMPIMLDDLSLAEREYAEAERVQATHFAYRLAVTGNVPGVSEHPTLQWKELTVLGNMAANGSFEPLIFSL